MKFTRIPIICALLVVLVQADDKITLDDLENDAEQRQLPVLPPLILLDFTNNTNSSSEEKSKRTVNDNLGYGFQANNFFAGRKVNYYFPSGKSGTAVSIEESITPFLPRTIVERTKPVREKPEMSVAKSFSAFKSQPQFGQKTKLHPTSDFQTFTTTKPEVTTNNLKTVYATSMMKPLYSGFYTPKPLFVPSFSTKKSYDATTRTSTEATFSPRFVSTSTLNPIISEQFYHPVKTLPLENPTVPASYPKYTWENGVKYEHKIVWKYPDGRILENPPNTYLNSYSEYDSIPKAPNFEPKPKDNFRSNLRYQGPMQFPKDSEVNLPKQGSFVKSVQSSTPRPKNYFQNYSIPKLEVGTPNAEYLPPADASSKGPAFGKYYSHAEKLSKGLSPPKESYDTDESGTYSNYANLLNNNPFISQYIKNPASILNAKPTFIQAGNSLIPVIILRVDGAPPVQQTSLPNINLKALLQQYITQYANSVSNLSRGPNYELGDDQLVNQYQDPHYDLKKLTDTLKQFSQRTFTPRPNIGDSVTDSYGNVLGAEYTSLAETRKNYNYHSLYKKPQKVKSVEIIEDPRFPNYKESNLEKLRV